MSDKSSSSKRSLPAGKAQIKKEGNLESGKKECFIITPIGEESSEIRREIDGLTKTVFRPILSEYGFEPVVAHEISRTGSINKQVIEKIIQSDLVIANLSDLNPNVMYELGIRHCVRKPVIVVARSGVRLPFDLSHERTITYKNDIAGVQELKESLGKMIPHSIQDQEPDNPVYRVVDVGVIQYPDENISADDVINIRLSQMSDQLEEVSGLVKRTMIGSSDTVSWAMPPRSPKYGIVVDSKDDEVVTELLIKKGVIFTVESSRNDKTEIFFSPKNKIRPSFIYSYLESSGLSFNKIRETNSYIGSF